MRKGIFVAFGIFALRLFCVAIEVPCGIDKEADRLIVKAKNELGVYSATVVPHITKIRDSGGMDVATADATFDKLAAQARKDGYDLRSIVAELKTFNRLVVECKDYPAYLKKLKDDRERAAKAREEKKQAELSLQKQKEEEERLARLEVERLEREREAQRRIELENERERQEAERMARLAVELEKEVEQMVASLSKGMVIRIPSDISPGSLISTSDRGNIYVLSNLVASGEHYVVTIKELRDLSDTGDTLDQLIRVVKKRKSHDITFTKQDFIKIRVLAQTERSYRR